jgi:hemerythrin superfamily protein
MSSQSKLDAVALLKADHRKVEDLFEKFEGVKAVAKEQALVHQICTELLVHTIIEEEMFYPAWKAARVDEDDIEEAYVEHDGAKVLIAELLASSPNVPFFDAKVKVLSEQIKHHVRKRRNVRKRCLPKRVPPESS